MRQILQIVVNETEDGMFVVKIGYGEQVTTSDECEDEHTALVDAVEKQGDTEELYDVLGWDVE